MLRARVVREHSRRPASADDFSGVSSVSLDAEVGTCPYSRGEDRICGLVGPGGVLDKKQMSTAPPTLRILTPAEGERAKVENGRVRVTWKAEGEQGRKLLYTILSSSHGGEHFETQAFELEEPTFDVTVDPKAKSPRVKVIATDGTRSSEAIIPLRP